MYGTNPLDPDTDNDGILDGVEIAGYNITIYYNDIVKTMHVYSNPLMNDTDNDGLSDQEELSLRSNPLVKDTDNDGLSDLEERKLASSLRNSDTDGDGLSDADELNGYEISYLDVNGSLNYINVISDPLNNDTDSDGLEDYLEFTLKSDVSSKDTDQDSLDDYDEYYSRYIKNGILQPTQINNADSDGDTLSDGIEVKGWTLYTYNLDPIVIDDTNGIILNNNGKIQSRQEEKMISTNPLMKDTDGDSIADNIELYPDQDGEITRKSSDPTLVDSDFDGILDLYDTEPVIDEYHPPNIINNKVVANFTISTSETIEVIQDMLIGILEDFDDFFFGTSPYDKSLKDQFTNLVLSIYQSGQSPTFSDIQTFITNVITNHLAGLDADDVVGNSKTDAEKAVFEFKDIITFDDNAKSTFTFSKIPNIIPNSYTITEFFDLIPDMTIETFVTDVTSYFKSIARNIINKIIDRDFTIPNPLDEVKKRLKSLAETTLNELATNQGLQLLTDTIEIDITITTEEKCLGIIGFDGVCDLPSAFPYTAVTGIQGSIKCDFSELIDALTGFDLDGGFSVEYNIGNAIPGGIFETNLDISFGVTDDAGIKEVNFYINDLLFESDDTYNGKTEGVFSFLGSFDINNVIGLFTENSLKINPLNLKIHLIDVNNNVRIVDLTTTEMNLAGILEVIYEETQDLIHSNSFTSFLYTNLMDFLEDPNAFYSGLGASLLQIGSDIVQTSLESLEDVWENYIIRKFNELRSNYYVPSYNMVENMLNFYQDNDSIIANTLVHFSSRN